MGVNTGEVCVACGSPEFRLWITKTSSYDGRPYPIFKCAACGSAFVIPRPKPEYREEYYSGSSQSHAQHLQSYTAAEAYEKVLQDELEFPNSGVDAERIAGHCKSLAPGNRFLDIGAGYGFFSRAALQSGFQVTAIEPTKECRDVIRLMCGIEPLAGMLTSGFVQANKGRFDVVLMSQVLEHITDLDATLGSFRDLLGKDGIVVIAVPHFGSWLSKLQGRNDMFIMPPEHVNFFSREGLAKLFKRHGLTFCESHTVSRINLARAEKKVPIPLVGRAASQSVLALLQLSDRFQQGMFINSYFRKSGD